jgi:hypothetical protein
MPNLLAKSTNSELCVRHGAVVGLSEIVLALKKKLPDDSVTDLSELVPKLEKLRLYRGRGGEVMRAAVCRYIECLSLADVPLTVKQQVCKTEYCLAIHGYLISNNLSCVGSTARFRGRESETFE